MGSLLPQFDLAAHQAQPHVWRKRRAEIDAHRERRRDDMERNRQHFEIQQAEFKEDIRRARDGEKVEGGGGAYDWEEDVDVMDVEEDDYYCVRAGS